MFLKPFCGIFISIGLSQLNPMFIRLFHFASFLLLSFCFIFFVFVAFNLKKISINLDQSPTECG